MWRKESIGKEKCFVSHFFWKLLRRNNLSIVITHFFSFFPFLSVKCSLNKFPGVISLKIENAPRWKLLVHEIIESSFVDRIMMIWQQKKHIAKFLYGYTCVTAVSVNISKNSLFTPQTSFPKTLSGDQKVFGNVIGLKLPYYGIFHSNLSIRHSLHPTKKTILKVLKRNVEHTKKIWCP